MCTARTSGPGQLLRDSRQCVLLRKGPKNIRQPSPKARQKCGRRKRGVTALLQTDSYDSAKFVGDLIILEEGTPRYRTTTKLSINEETCSQYNPTNLLQPFSTFTNLGSCAPFGPYRRYGTKSTFQYRFFRLPELVRPSVSSEISKQYVQFLQRHTSAFAQSFVGPLSQ